MPLEPGRSKAVIRRNTKREIAAGKSPEQAYAIANAEAGTSKPKMTKRKQRKAARRG